MRSDPSVAGVIPPNLRILLDCRLLGKGGPGRATEFLLRGLQELRPSGRWILWGSDSVRDYEWETAETVVSSASPRWLASQVALPTMPRHDVAIYMHQVRPLRPGRAVTLIHDTLALRYGGTPLRRAAQRASLLAVSRMTGAVVTVSECSKQAILRDLPLSASKVKVVRYPVDSAFVGRVLALRQQGEVKDRVLYVGQFAEHKNLHRLVRAFGRSRLAASGGELVLAGGDPADDPGLQREAAGFNIMFEGLVSQERLEELYASSRLLVMPSLEEGFGLPAWEALSIGLPVCAADIGSLREVTHGRAVLCDPLSVAAITQGIDEATDMVSVEPVGGPTMSEFACVFLESLLEVVESRK